MIIVVAVQLGTEALESLMLGESASVNMMGKIEAFFEALHDTGDANLDELIEVAGRDGKKFDALEQGVGGVVGFFEDAAVELEPALVAIDESAARWCCGSFGGAAWRGRGRRLRRCGR